MIRVQAVQARIRVGGPFYSLDIFLLSIRYRLCWSARFYTIISEKEKALGLLERAYEDTTIDMEGLVYYPEFDSLRAEPWFKALLKKIGLRELFDQYGRRIR